MTDIVDYTLLFERQFRLWLDFDPFTNDDFPYAIRDANANNEVITRSRTMKVALSWMMVFQKTASATVDRDSIEIAMGTAALKMAFDEDEHSVRVPNLRIVS